MSITHFIMGNLLALLTTGNSARSVTVCVARALLTCHFSGFSGELVLRLFAFECQRGKNRLTPHPLSSLRLGRCAVKLARVLQ